MNSTTNTTTNAPMVNTTQAVLTTTLKLTTDLIKITSRVNDSGASGCDGGGGHGNESGGGDHGGSREEKIEELKLALHCVLGITLGLTMVAMGASIELKDFKIVLKKPVGVAIGFLCQVVIMPLIGFILALVLNMEATNALGVLITASSPGGTTSNLYTFWTDGDICLSVIMTTISTIVAMGSMPLNLLIYSRRWTGDKANIPYTDIIVALICIIGPVALGMLLRWWKKKWAIAIGKPFGALGMIGIIVSIGITSAINPRIWDASWEIYLSGISHAWIGWGIGYAISRMTRQSHKQSRTIAFETGSQHVGLALAVIAFSYKSDIRQFLNIIIYPMIYGPFSIISFSSWVLVYKFYRHYRPEQVEEEGDEEEKKEMKSPELANGKATDVEKGDIKTEEAKE